MIVAILRALGFSKLGSWGAVVFASFMWWAGIQGKPMFSTTFGPPSIDRYNTGGHACMVSELRPNREARLYVDRGALVAVRDLPCWTEIQLISPRTGRTENAVVADRGPYGVNAKGIDVWTGTHDAPGISHRLRLNGGETVHVWLTGRHLATRKSKERKAKKKDASTNF